MRHLCDTNIFVAMALSGHPHHPKAKEWFESLPDGETVEFCRMTQSAFLRFLSSEAILKDLAVSNREAIEKYRQLVKDSAVRFCAEPEAIEELWFQYSALPTKSPKRWTDAYLAAFACRGKLRLVTFDVGFRQFDGLDCLILNANIDE